MRILAKKYTFFWVQMGYIKVLPIFFFIRTAMEIQKYLDVSFEKMTALVKSLTEKFHDRHYLLILVKKHITFMYGDDLGSLSKEELKDRLKLCEEVCKY